MNSKIYKICFFVLLVINMALVLFLVLSPKPPARLKGIKEQISEELRFNDQQKAVFDEMAMAHREQMNAISKQEKALIRKYLGQLVQKEGPVDEAAILQQINALHAQKIEVTYEHFAQLKSLCTDEQLVLYDQIVEQMLEVLLDSDRTPPPPR